MVMTDLKRKCCLRKRVAEELAAGHPLTWNKNRNIKINWKLSIILVSSVSFWLSKATAQYYQYNNKFDYSIWRKHKKIVGSRVRMMIKVF